MAVIETSQENLANTNRTVLGCD